MQKLDHRFGDDGAFWMSYEDLLKKYQTFDRTRLFDEDWKVTQQWTSLTVPWTVDYQDTKFSFTLEKKAPVVIVLSQVIILRFRDFCKPLILVSSMVATSQVSRANTTSNFRSVFIKRARMTTSYAAMAITGCGDRSLPNSSSNQASTMS
jgi:hypothetical protein